jgi:hypothetical protein
MKRMFVFNHMRLTFFLAVALVCMACGREDEMTTGESAEEVYMSDYAGPADKWGFMNNQGEVVIPPVYDQVSAFTSGVAAVSREGRWGYIDHDGEVVVNYAYLAAWPFREQLARITRFDRTPCILRLSGDTTCLKGVDVLYDFSHGIARFERATRYGYVDGNGEIVIDPVFERAWDFHGGLARVVRDGKYGVIDTSGTFVVKALYDRLKDPQSGYIAARSGDQSFFLTIDGRRITGFTYLDATSFQGHCAGVREASGWYLIDTAGIHIAGPFTALRPAGENMWVAKRGGDRGLIDASGEAVTEFAYQQINNFSEGIAVYGRDGLWGYMSSDGMELTPPQYGLAWDFKEGLARAAFRDGIAYITPEGKIPFFPRFDEFRDFSEGLAPFQER